MKTSIHSVKHHTRLAFSRAYAEFKFESTRMYLGSLWWIIEPLLNMIVYYIVFGLFFQRGGADFVPFLLTGLVMWRLFSETFLGGSNAILQNISLVRQFPLRKAVFPSIVLLKNLYQFVFSLALLLVILFLYGIFPTVYWLLFPVILIMFIIFTAGMMLPLASIVPFVPDLHKGVSNIVRLVFFMSGVLYDYTTFSEKYQALLRLNPILHYITAFRDVFMYSRCPEFGTLLWLTGLGFLGIIVGLKLTRHFDDVYAKRVTQ